MRIKYAILCFLCVISIFTHTIKTKNVTHITIEDDFNKYNNANPFAPVLFTATGLHDFFENIYNKYWYGKDFLPNNFSHMMQFLEYGKKTKQNGAYLKSVMKLFGNKLKSASYVNSYAFIDLLEVMPDFAKHYFEPPQINFFEQNQKKVNNLMYNNFLTNFSSFKKDPKEFLNTMSQDIVATLKKQTKEIESQVNLEHLRQSLTRFLELSLGKIIWSPEDHENIWNLFLSLSKAIESFSKQKIIDDADNIDDLYWSLIHRFCFFLDVTGHELPIEFYADFKNKLFAANLLMFQIEEQEQHITNKETHLVQALFEGEARARAYKTGLITS